jgi:hypothetical protein
MKSKKDFTNIYFNPEETSYYQKWRKNCSDQDATSLLDYMSYYIKPVDFLIIAKILFPEFVIVDDIVFLNLTFNEDAYNSYKMRGESREKIQIDLNNIRLWDVFLSNSKDLDDHGIEDHILLVILNTWNLALKHFFPKKKFKIQYEHSTPNSDAEITFFELESN